MKTTPVTGLRMVMGVLAGTTLGETQKKKRDHRIDYGCPLLGPECDLLHIIIYLAVHVVNRFRRYFILFFGAVFNPVNVKIL